MEPKRIDIKDDLKTSYAIPLWLRDLQIASAIARKDIGRIEPVEKLRDVPIAVACFGPTLNDTWEEIKRFKYLVTCSGSHKFLLEKGLDPDQFESWWHVEVDPRAHKVQLLGDPHPKIIYLPSATCHPSYFDHLQKHKAIVKLWHVYDPDKEGMRVLPSSEWALTGGSSVGLRAMTIARFFGFTDQHVFGMDGNEGTSGKHAAAHPNQPKEYVLVEVNGREFKTTPAMLACAKQTAHELDMMVDARATFYGDGLTREIMKDYVPKKKVEGSQKAIALVKPDLISAEYRDLNKKLHADNLMYGIGGAKYSDVVLKVADSIKTRSVLDYGCGKSQLARALNFPIWEYDPAIEGKEESPRAADLVTCLDVLEHVEPEKIVFVLDDLRRVTLKVGYFVIHTGPSSKSLADGRNAHILQRNKVWWEKMLSKFFEIGWMDETPPLLQVVVGPKPKIKKHVTLDMTNKIVAAAKGLGVRE